MELIRENYITFPENAAFLKKIFPQDDEIYYYSFLKYDPFFAPDVYKRQYHGMSNFYFHPHLVLLSS